MERINARIVALGLLAAGLLLGTVALLSMYGENPGSVVSYEAHHSARGDAPDPHS
jgi:hypothetical protein